MKKVEDFKLKDGIATLEGVAYVDEAKVVRDFLKANQGICDVSVISKDGRYYKLDNEKLVPSTERIFRNPYFVPDYTNPELNNIVIGEQVENNRLIELDEKIKVYTSKCNELREILEEIASFIYLKRK